VNRGFRSNIALGLALGCCLAFVGLSEPSASAAPPRILYYQGYLTDSDGAPMQGAWAIQASLYDAAAGGNLLWQESHGQVALSGGFFVLPLGSIQAFGDLFTTHDTLFLGISVNGGDELAPRTPLGSVPWSLGSADAVNAQMCSEADHAAAADKLGSTTENDLVSTDDLSNSTQALTDALDGLQQACTSHRLSRWPGFGSRLEQQLIPQIKFKLQHARDFLFQTAGDIADLWQQKLLQLPSVVRVELTGQIRRGNELIQAIDLLLQGDPELLKDELLHILGLAVENSDPILIRDPSGIPVKLWLTTAADYPRRQLLLTGGQVFQKQLSQLRQEKGLESELRFSEPELGGQPDEQTLCTQLGIQWIAPELRDTQINFPADRTLIEMQDIKGMLHVHSTWSDGRNSLEEMVRATIKLGYTYLGISDHSQAAYYAHGLKPERVKVQWERIEALNQYYQPFHIFKGIEADILKNGSLDYDEELLAGFDFVIASIHSHFNLSPRQQTDRLVRALQSPFTTILGHPTGRMLLARSGYHPDHEVLLSAAAEYGKIIELNCSPKRLDLDWRYLASARELGIPIAIDPDAHGVDGLETIPQGVTMARKGGLSAADVLNTLDLNSIQAYFQTRKHV